MSRGVNLEQKSMFIIMFIPDQQLLALALASTYCSLSALQNTLTHRADHNKTSESRVYPENAKIY